MALVSDESAFVLHLRPYRNSSAIVDFLSHEHGRVSCVAKGFKTGNARQGWRAALQLFNRVGLSWSGNSELKTLRDVQLQAGYPLKQQAVFCGFYINELVERLLHSNDPHADVFQAYHLCLHSLVDAADPQPALRRFEFALLDSLGYGLQLDQDCRGEALDRQRWYRYESGLGLMPCPKQHPAALPGGALLGLAEGESGEANLAVAKQLSRQALAALLGDKPLRSRALFSAGRTRD